MPLHSHVVCCIPVKSPSIFHPHSFNPLNFNPRCMSFILYLVGGLVAMDFIFPLILGISLSQLTNSYFSEGWPKTTNQIRLHHFHWDGFLRICCRNPCGICSEEILMGNPEDLPHKLIEKRLANQCVFPIYSSGVGKCPNVSHHPTDLGI